eukprot:354997-Amphidinium_carterae.2
MYQCSKGEAPNSKVVITSGTNANCCTSYCKRRKTSSLTATAVIEGQSVVHGTQKKDLLGSVSLTFDIHQLVSPLLYFGRGATTGCDMT